MKKTFWIMTLVCLCLTLSVSFAFNDVNEQMGHAEAIKYLKDNEILNGYPDGTFKSDNIMTRAEFAKLIVVSEKLTLSGDAKIEFSDISEHWAEEYIKILVSHNLIKGYPDGTFKPQNTITLAESTTIISRILGINENVDNLKWPDTYMEFAKEKDLFKNITINSGDENLEVKRGDIAELVFNKINYDKTQKELEAARNCDGASNRTTDHRVVSHSHEAHHLDVSRNR